MSWSVACQTDRPYLYVIAYYDFVESRHLYCNHIGFGKKTFVWYLNEEDYLEDIHLPYWRQYGKLLNTSNGIYINNDTPFINEILPVVLEVVEPVVEVVEVLPEVATEMYNNFGVTEVEETNAIVEEVNPE